MKESVSIELCEALLRDALEGYQGFPPTAGGVRRFAFAVQQNVVSVGHARATLAAFDEKFPTVRQIADVAFNLRAQFETSADDRAEWERQFGKPHAFDKYPSDELAMYWQALRDAHYYIDGPGRYELDVDPDILERGQESFWKGVYRRALADHPDSLIDIRGQAADYGWKALREMTASPRAFRYRSSRPQRTTSMPHVASPITEDDIKRAEREKRLKNATVVIELPLELPAPASEELPADDSWDDPDR
jgi:hypothetical protein